MIRRWTHLHSIGTGLVFGLVLDREALVIFFLGLALGVALVVAWRFVSRFTGWARRAAPAAAEVIALRDRKTEAEIERKLAAAEEARARAEHRVRTAGEQRDAERRAYYAGARDGSPEQVKQWDWQDADAPPETILGVPVPQREPAS